MAGSKITLNNYIKQNIVPATMGIIIYYIISTVWNAYDMVVIPLYNPQMSPTLKPKDFYVASTINPDQIEHDQIVYYAYPHRRKADEALFLGRVIGLPGDIISIKKGKVYRNGEVVEERYVSQGESGDDSLPGIIVPKNYVYLMVDKRKDLRGQELHKRDSRILGPILMTSVRGTIDK